MCGEHVAENNCRASLSGSSPRVRGTPDVSARHVEHVGIIPACAGNTTANSAFTIAARDHPRVCGEHHDGAHQRLRGRGSSPRVRGTHQARREEARGLGIIPACAGNTSPRSRTRNSSRDHPRVCGEHQALEGIRALFPGSSPRVRGTPPWAVLVP